MNKKEMQQRVLQNGKPLSLDKFEWDEANNVFSSKEDCLVIDCGSNCTIDCGSNCTIDCESNCTIKAMINSVCVRRDIFEFFELPNGIEIKLNKYKVKGYTTTVKEKKKVTLELTDEQLEKVKEIIN